MRCMRLHERIVCGRVEGGTLKSLFVVCLGVLGVSWGPRGRKKIKSQKLH